MKKIICLLTAVLVALVLAAGCGANKEPGASQQASLQKVTVLLDWVPNTNHTGLYVAKDKGYYREEGLEVEIVQPSEGGTAQLIAAGKGDFGVSYQEEVTTARAADVPVTAVAAVIQHNTSGFAAPADKNIKTPRDFEGKRYGGWGSPMESAMIKALMDKHGADFSKVEIVNIGSADFFTSIEKDVDFAWIYSGWTGVEADLRGISLDFIKLRDEDPSLDFYTPVIIVKDDKVKSSPDLIKKFLKATGRGYTFAAGNPDEAAQVLIDAVPEINTELVRVSQKHLAPEYKSDAPRWGEMKSEVWKGYADWMFQRGLIPKNIDPEKAFTNEFLPVE